MRRPSQDARLPTWAIQLFGMLVVTAMAVYAIMTKSTEVALACITTAAACIGVSVFDRARREVEKAMTPALPPAVPEEERERS